MEKRIDAGFRRGDDVLKDLVTQRRAQVESLQSSLAETMKAQEQRGQQRLKAELAQADDSVRALIDRAQGARAADKDEIEKIRKRLIDSKPDAMAFNENPGTYQIAPAAAFAGWLTPYYATLHGSNGSIYWQGYNPGNFDLSDWASGSGSGLFGTGAASFHVYLDWWFAFNADVNKFYSQQIYVPFNGFHIVRADDAWYDSKHAEVNISLSARGYQYNWKGTSSTNVLHVAGDNINVNDRFDGWRTFNYSTLLGADTAYLLVTADFYVYARGGGSYAELNFSDGNANYVGIPYVYVS